MMNVKHKLVFPLILMLFGTAVGVGICEILARSFKLSKTWESYIASKIYSQNMITEDKVGYRRTPNATFVSARDVQFRINSVGFRDREFSRKGKTCRIAFLGDSITEGFGVDEEDRFSNKVEAKLSKLASGCESLNFGIAGYSTADEYESLKKYVMEFSPRYLVLQVCINDFDRNAAIHNKSYNMDNNDRDGGVNTSTIKRFLQKHSAFYLFLAENYTHMKLISNKSTNLIPSESSIDPLGWSETTRIIKEIDEYSKKNGIKLFVSYVPLNVEVVAKDESLAMRVNNRIEKFSNDNSIGYIRTINALRGHSNKKDIYLDDCHLSVKGHEIVADEIAGFFIKSGLQ